MIVFDNVKLKYHYDQFELLKGASFVLDQEINTILCDTQSGKTSICRLLCKDIACDGGIFVDEKPINSITSQDLGILYLPSKPTFFERRNALCNVEYPLKVRKVEKNKRKQISLDILQRFNFGDVTRKVKALTEKERKLLALARGITVERKIVLFDDFFDDRDAMANAFELFPDSTKIVLTSDVNLACGKTVVLDGGITVYQGDADGAKQQVSRLVWLNESLRSKDNG